MYRGKPTEHYDLFEHRHRYAVWAAARATQRGWSGAKTPILVKGIEASGVVEVVRADHLEWPTTADDFDRAHRRWCETLMATLDESGVEDVTFGRAAKLIAIYIKSMIIVGGHHESPFARVAAPPIDEILLRSLAADRTFDRGHRRLWRTTKWTKMTAGEHAAIISSFRSEGLDRPVFWMIERYWKP